MGDDGSWRMIDNEDHNDYGDDDDDDAVEC